MMGVVWRGIRGSVGGGIMCGIRGSVGRFHQRSGGVFQWRGIVMDWIMHRLRVNLHNGLRVGHDLAEARVTLGERRSHGLYNWGRVVSVDGSGRMIWRGGVIRSRMHERSGVFDSGGCVVGTGHGQDRGCEGGGGEEAEDLQRALVVRGGTGRNNPTDLLRGTAFCTSPLLVTPVRITLGTDDH